MIGPIKTVTVYVNDQQKALEFYTQKLGFEVRRSLPMGPNGQWVEVSPSGAQTCLVLYPKSMMPNATTPMLGVVFHCSDVESTCRHLESLGVHIGMSPKEMPWGMFASFQDPDGNEFGLTSQALA
jgi:lactoylglutathione lyase